MISSRATGSVIGKGGDKIKAMRSESGATVKLIGDDMPERLLKIGGSVDQVTQVIGMVANNLYKDYEGDNESRKPARVMARQQKSAGPDDVQICMLLCEPLIGPIVGKGGSNIKSMEENHRCQVNIWKQYPSGDFLPNSNERVITFTGRADCIPNAVNEVCQTIENVQVRGELHEWDLESEGPSGFFGQENGSFNRGRGGDGYSDRMGGNAPGWKGDLPPGVSPFLQKLPEEKNGNDIRLKANQDQVGNIIGKGGRRINDIRDMSGCKINIKETEGDSCMRYIEVYGNPQQSANAVWLINIAVNAFCDPASSLRSLNMDMPMEAVATSGAYGNPPSLQGQDNSFGGPPQGGNFGGPPQGGNFGGPPQGNNFGGPPQGGNFGGPPQGGNFGGPPQGGNFGGPPQNFNGPPQNQWGGAGAGW